jgi:regulatory protein
VDADAHEGALRSLRARDRSVQEVEARLAASGVGEQERARVLESLRRTGLLDDRRFAEGRASSLAGRGAGDALIRHELASAGIATVLVEDVLGTLDPEIERARAIVERRGAGARTARYLAGKGFPGDVVGAVATGAEDELG